jgi:glucan 1,3-beta-glucosidase
MSHRCIMWFHQNGLDNSGDTRHYKWIGSLSTMGAAYYDHWSMRGGDWAGEFDTQLNTIESIDYFNIIDTLKVINVIVDRFKDNDVVIGIEPGRSTMLKSHYSSKGYVFMCMLFCLFLMHSPVVNEPSEHIPLNVLKEFYWRSYQIVQLKAPHWITLLHDSFRLSVESFGGFLQHCDNFALDTHIYQAWAWENPPEWFQQHACLDRARLMEMEAAGVPVVVGEWSLATDNCAMWLNGLNDNGACKLTLSCTTTIALALHSLYTVS